MHILFVTPVVPSPSYGRRPYNFIRYLSREHQVYLATFLTSPRHDSIYLRQLAEWGVIARTTPHPKWRGILNCVRGFHRSEPLRSLWIQSKPLEQTIQWMLQQYPIEIAHFDRMRMGHYALDISNIPRVVDFTDALMLYLDRTRTPYRSLVARMIDWWERRTIPAYEARLLSQIEAGLCCSTTDQQVFARYHPHHPVNVIPNVVDAGQFRPRTREDSETRLVFTGTFSYFPNLDSLFYLVEDILPALNREHPGLQLDVIGARPPQSVRKLNQQPQIRVLADVPDMAEHLFSQDIFICPLRVASGMRNKILEAMAAGMTVISTTIGVEGLAVEPDRHYLKADSPGEFVSQIGKALNSQQLRNRLGTQAREFVASQHSLESAGQSLIQLYERVKKETG